MAEGVKKGETLQITERVEKETVVAPLQLYYNEHRSSTTTKVAFLPRDVLSGSRH